MATTTNDWHNVLKTATWKERNNFLLNKEFMSDCAFIVQNGSEQIKLRAHKYVLGGSSYEFYNLFFLMEAGSNEIPIAGFSVEVVKVFLELIYKESSAKLTMDIIWDVLNLANRYSVEGLKIFCGEFLVENLTNENALELLDKSSVYELENFNVRCMMQMSLNENRNWIETDFFLEIQNKTLCNILKSYELRGNELEIYKAAYKWGENFCEKNNQIRTTENIRLALGEAFKLIRFGAMTASEFSTCIDDSSILNSKEMIQIFKLIAVGESECDFSNVKRTRFGIKELKFEQSSTGYGGYNCYVDITSNKHIFLNGICLNYFDIDEISLDNPRSLLHLTILLEAPNEKLVNHTTKSIYLSKYRQEDTVCRFTKAVYCQAHIKYRIWFFGLSFIKYKYSDLQQKSVNFNNVVFSINSPVRTPLAGLIYE